MNKPIKAPHSSSFLDIDGDCTSDILIVSPDVTTGDVKTDKNLEIWRGTRRGDKIKFCLKKNAVLPLLPELNLFSIADINRDGLFDLVFPVTTGLPRVLTVFNQLSLSNWSLDYCEAHQNSNNKLTKIFEISTDLSSTSSIDGSDDTLWTNYKNTLYFIYENADQQFYFEAGIPKEIRVGDIDSDSYTDITFVLHDKSTKENSVYVFLNCGVQNSNKRIYLSNCNNHEIKINNKGLNHPVLSSFFDLDDNGQLDLLIIQKPVDSDNDDKVTYENKGLFNNNVYDSFFLKSINTMIKDKYSAFSVGTTYRYVVTNLDGSKRTDVAVQAAQLSGVSLNLPFAFIGIGRSNNYIEDFHVISTTYPSDKENYNIFTPVIPNSQILISENEADGTLNWQYELIVNPISKLLLLIIVIGGLLFILLVAICYLHRKEVKEDQENDNLHFIQWFN